VVARTQSRPGFARPIQRVWSRVLEGLFQRFDLIGIELKQEKERLLGFLLAGMVVSLLAFMAFLVFNMTILAVAWEHRVPVLLIMLAVYIGLALGLGWRLWYKVRSAPAPFSATVEEFKKDRATFFPER
jgi:uncharacterized membrane protein YqjE